MADVPDHLLPENQSASSMRVKADPTARTPVSRTLLLWLTYGVAGTVLFPIIYEIEGATRPGYDAWRQTISALTQGPTGWIQQLDFALCGVSVLWLAFVWRKILKGGVCATWYPIFRGIEGLALVAIAILTQDPLHTVCLVVIVNAMCFGLFVIARRFWKQPLWRGWTTFSVACGLWPMVVMPLFGIALNTHSVLSGYAGLFERLATNADTVWSLVLVVYLWVRRPIGI
ncbi:MAG TPA: DUF998 domain-containing protein [Ktedonosporobacter sp.]|nr:DUF998 domain-containing protein [Ktedonosporobacter sp.]